MTDEVDKARQEYTLRVLYSLFGLGVGLADRHQVPMKKVTTLLQRAYYQAKKMRGLTLPEMAKELEMSTRTADRLAKSMREDFFTPEEGHGLPRRVEFMLWDGPKSAARLQQLLPDVSEEEFRVALAHLEEAGRIELQTGRTQRYRATRRANRLMDDSMAARVDGLNHLLSHLRETVHRRFFKEDPGAGARSVGLRVCREDLGELEALYEEVVWRRLVELDNKARQADPDDIVEVGVVMCWSPLDDEDGGEGDKS